MPSTDLTDSAYTDDPTRVGFASVPSCTECGPDMPCFDHYRMACPNGRYDCDGPRSGSHCRACRRALAGRRFGR